MANRLALIMPSLIHPSQAGFTLGHSAQGGEEALVNIIRGQGTIRGGQLCFWGFVLWKGMIV